MKTTPKWYSRQNPLPEFHPTDSKDQLADPAKPILI